MTAIDVHFHLVPRSFVDALRRGDFADAVDIVTEPERDLLVFHPPPGILVEPDLSIRPRQYDAPTLRAALQARRLDAAAASPPPELLLHWAPPELSERIAQTMNDGMAQLATAHPDCFLPLAMLPMQDPQRAVRELHRAITSLGLRGVALCTHVGGADLDRPEYEPVFAAAASLGAPVFLHPQNAGDISRITERYLWNLVGFPMETAIAASRLLTGGLFARNPALNVILAHGGGYLPFQLGRLDHGWRQRPDLFPALPKPPSAYLQNIYCDSLTHDGAALRFLLDRMGPDQVVLGTDYPFAMQCDDPVGAIDALGLAPRVRAGVVGENLVRLFSKERKQALLF